jgi:murein DD-endopeptidase MepM/ murein hydrolase activator NlpD
MASLYTNPLLIMRIRGSEEPLCGIGNTMGWVRKAGKKPHDGWDLAAPPGTPTFAITKGVVVFVGPLEKYGNTVIISFEHQGQSQ